MSIQHITLNALDHILTLELNKKWRPPPSQILVRWHLWSRYPIQSYHLYLRDSISQIPQCWAKLELIFPKFKVAAVRHLRIVMSSFEASHECIQ